MVLKRGLVFLMSAMIFFSACNKNSDADTEQSSAPESSVSETAGITETSKSAAAPDASVNPDFKYYVRNNEVTLTAYIGSDTNVVIPEYIEGCPVVKYSAGLLKGTEVREITFPRTVTIITDINYADKLETINLSSGTSKLFPARICSCKSLKNINAEKGGEFMSIDGVLYSADGKTLVCCPPGRTGEFTVPTEVETIGESAFYYSSLTAVILPDGLRSVGSYGFAYSSLASTELPAGLAEIGAHAFANSCIDSIKLPEGLVSIGTSAFLNTNISEIYIPDSVKSCGLIFGYDKRDKKISAPLSAIYAEGMSSLLGYENVTYRGETELDRLLRKTGKIDPEYTKGRIFIDLDGDNFPEMIHIDKYGRAELKQFDIPSGRWEYIFHVYSDTDLNLYYDKENDEYFYLYTEWAEQASVYYVTKLNVTEDGFVWGDASLGMFEYHTKGHWDESGNEHTYITEKSVDFGYLDGKYFIGENDLDFENKVFREAMSGYELVSSVNIQKIIDEYGDEDQLYEIVMSPFAGSPEPSPYKKPVHEKTEEADYITIGEEKIPVDSQVVHLYAEDVSEENFEKLSHLPRLTVLNIGARYYPDSTPIDLTGIDKLTGLGELSVFGTDIKNAAEIGKLTNLKVLRISADADDLTFLKAMDNLMVIQFSSTVDKPADFYKPIYGMKNLRYLFIDWWDLNITQEQEEHIAENAPHINAMYYKWG